MVSQKNAMPTLDKQTYANTSTLFKMNSMNMHALVSFESQQLATASMTGSEVFSGQNEPRI